MKTALHSSFLSLDTILHMMTLLDHLYRRRKATTIFFFSCFSFWFFLFEWNISLRHALLRKRCERPPIDNSKKHFPHTATAPQKKQSERACVAMKEEESLYTPIDLLLIIFLSIISLYFFRFSLQSSEKERKRRGISDGAREYG